MDKHLELIRNIKHRLGNEPDSLIAEDCGVQRRTICFLRNRLGISPFVGLLLSQEGQPCRSVLEAKYDAYLHWKLIPHEHEVPVAGTGYVADFLIRGVRYIEIFGMLSYSKYAEKAKAKWLAYDKLSLEVSYYEPESVDHLYRECPLKIRFRSRTCSACGNEAYDLVSGVCRGSCHTRQWREVNSVVDICIQCNNNYKRDPNAKRKFCSRKCYWESMTLDWPSWEIIDDKLKNISVAGLAREIGIKPTTLYQHINRRQRTLAR